MPERDRRGGPAALGGVLAGLLAFLVVVLLVVRWGEDQPRAAPPVDLGAGPATESPDVPASPPPTDTSAPVSPVPDPTDREPTDDDAAAFTASYEPPGGREVEAVTVDLDGDERPEVVVASVAGDVVRLDVAVWDQHAYAVAHTDQGGPAESILDFSVRDVTGDDAREIVTVQVGDEGRESLAIWGWSEGELVRMTAVSGCWDGSHVYGHTGADIIAGEIVATCPPVPDEVPAGTRDVYAWDGQAWRYDRTEGP